MILYSNNISFIRQNAATTTSFCYTFCFKKNQLKFNMLFFMSNGYGRTTKTCNCSLQLPLRIKEALPLVWNIDAHSVLRCHHRRLDGHHAKNIKLINNIRMLKLLCNLYIWLVFIK